MFLPEIWDNILNYCDLLTLARVAQVNPELQKIAVGKIKKMKKIICGTFVTFKKDERFPDEDLWEMKKIVISQEGQSLVLKNHHSWSSEYFVHYDQLLGEYSIDQDVGSMFLPADGYLRCENDENISITFNMAMENENSCKLEMYGVGDEDKKYNRTMVWTKDGKLCQNVKYGDKEDVREFHHVHLDSRHYLVVNDDDSNPIDNPIFSVTISPACLSSLSLSWPHLVLLRVGVKQLIIRPIDSPGFLRGPVRDGHIRVSKGIREYLGVERGEVLELEPSLDISFGSVDLKVMSVQKLIPHRPDPGFVDFGRMIKNFKNYVEQLPWGVVFNEGIKFAFTDEKELINVQFEVQMTTPSPACMVKVEQVRVVV